MKKSDTLKVLEAIGQRRKSSKDILQKAIIAKNRAYVILSTLADLGYAERSDYSRTWALTIKGKLYIKHSLERRSKL